MNRKGREYLDLKRRLGSAFICQLEKKVKELKNVIKNKNRQIYAMKKRNKILKFKNRSKKSDEIKELLKFKNRSKKSDKIKELFQV